MKTTIRAGSRACFLIILLFIPFHIYPIERLPAMDTRSFALGASYSLSTEMMNPAFLSIPEQIRAGASVQNRFGMDELNTANLYCVLPNRWLDAGLKLSAFGFEDYQVLQLQGSLAKQIAETWFLGVSCVYSTVSSVLEESDRSQLYADIGIGYVPDEKWRFALLGENLLHTEDERLIRLSLAASYIAFENGLILVQTSYADSEGFALSAGIEYNLMEKFKLRGGYRTDTGMPSFGIAYQLSKLQLEAGFSLHSTLGLSSMIGLMYTF